MKKGKEEGSESRKEIRSILTELCNKQGWSIPDAYRESPPANDFDAFGQYDFDLAEFPLFRLDKHGQVSSREPLVYTDTIKGKDGQPVTRTWKTFPGPYGFGGATTQVLLFDLLQLYIEQGARGSQIQFGTLRSLFQRHTDRHPSKKDYQRMERDMDILRGYDFHCENAFWDRRRQAYVNMKWGLFGAVFYFKPSPDDTEQELPFGFIEASQMLQHIAKTRGFFSLGFKRPLFYQLKPLEQRLAIYLAKKFVSQKLHQRYVDDLAKALPVEAANESNAKKSLTRAARGLLIAEIPFLKAFRFEKGSDGRSLIVFERGQAPKQDTATFRQAAQELSPELGELVERIVEAVGTGNDRYWWTQCVKRLGRGAVDRALGHLKETQRTQTIRSRGAFLTSYFQKIAREYGVSLH